MVDNIESVVEESEESENLNEGLIEIGSAAWLDLIRHIATSFEIGELIPHERLNYLFGMKPIKLADFNNNQEEYDEAKSRQQFAYFTLTDRLRWDVLENEKFFLRTVKGKGYVIVHPKYQTAFAIEKTAYEVKKALKEGFMIAENVRISQLDIQQRKIDADRKVSFNMHRQMILGLLRKDKYSTNGK